VPYIYTLWSIRCCYTCICSTAIPGSIRQCPRAVYLGPRTMYSSKTFPLHVSPEILPASLSVSPSLDGRFPCQRPQYVPRISHLTSHAMNVLQEAETHAMHRVYDCGSNTDGTSLWPCCIMVNCGEMRTRWSIQTRCGSPCCGVARWRPWELLGRHAWPARRTKVADGRIRLV
jgi:hypothetical protein